MYIWRLRSCLGHGTPADLVARAKLHTISSLWPKIADGATGFENIKDRLADKLRELVTLCHADRITVCGYHVPHCANTADAKAEAKFVCDVLADFKLDGLIIDNEDGAAYFKGGANEANTYGSALKQSLQTAGKFAAMSSNDIISYHPKAQANVIGQYINVNAPQVYYGQSPSVDQRLTWANNENAHIAVPFVPTGAAFVREPGKSDGGCADAAECGRRAQRFIALVSNLHQTNAAKYPGYSFWNWEEAPDQVWDVLRNTAVFV